MKNPSGNLASLLTTAWVGSLWAVGYLAVPVLFYAQPDRQLAGMLAGQMFTLVGYLGMVCGLYLLFQRIYMSGRASFREALFRIVAVMLLITLVLQFGIQPVMTNLKLEALPLDVMHSTFAEQFKMLHGVSSIFYLVQSLLGVFLVIKTQRDCQIKRAASAALLHFLVHGPVMLSAQPKFLRASSWHRRITCGCSPYRTADSLHPHSR
jgi:hypothetical protein